MAFASLFCVRKIHDTISGGKIPENIQLRLVFPLGIFPVDMTSSIMFLSQNTQGIFHLLIKVLKQLVFALGVNFKLGLQYVIIISRSSSKIDYPKFQNTLYGLIFKRKVMLVNVQNV